MNGAITLSEPRPRLRWSHQDRHLVDCPQTAALPLSCFPEGQTAPPEQAPLPRPAHLLSGELSYPVLEPQDTRRGSPLPQCTTGSICIIYERNFF